MGEMNTELASPSLTQLPSSSSPHIPSNAAPPPLSSSSSKPHRLNRSSRSRRHSLPFSFPPLFFQPSNPSSTSLVPSTAEGRPIPLDDTTAAHRTSALRQLNSNYPSQVNRHRYAKSSGAQSSTYSQPVIVRTYSGPSPAQGAHTPGPYPYRPSSSSRGGSRRTPLPSSSRSNWSFSGRPIKPTISGIGSSGSGTPSASRHGYLVGMPRPQTKQSRLSWHWPSASRRRVQDEARLPPLDAFSFKSFMAELQAQDGESGGISADLDRIAEICARSRYSLSNQYEVHLAPHGSGATFLSAAPSNGRRRGNNTQTQAQAQAQARSQVGTGGPTLQAINPDEEDGVSSRGNRKRRSGPSRRKSVAYGTLETIMSSSRSSEEEKSTKKKSAAEIADEVRGRAIRNKANHSADSESGAAAPTNSSPSCDGTNGTRDSPTGARAATVESGLAKKKSASFASAVIDSTRHTTPPDAMSPRSSANALLLSEPAHPQTSTSHLEIRTKPDDVLAPVHGHADPGGSSYDADRVAAQEPTRLDATPQVEEPRRPSPSAASGWDSWIPWRAAAAGEHGSSFSQRSAGGGSSPSHAEGSLRQLLKTSDVRDKGKAVDRDLRVKKSLEN